MGWRNSNSFLLGGSEDFRTGRLFGSGERGGGPFRGLAFLFSAGRGARFAAGGTTLSAAAPEMDRPARHLIGADLAGKADAEQDRAEDHENRPQFADGSDQEQVELGADPAAGPL